MNEIPLKQVIAASLENLKQAVNVDNVIGKPIPLDDGVIIPVSKVTLGYTAGGADFDGKRNPTRESPHFGGGAGAAMTVSPIAFLVVHGADVRLLNVNDPAGDGLVGTVNDLIAKAPSLISKVKGFFGKKHKDDEDDDEDFEIDETIVDFNDDVITDDDK